MISYTKQGEQLDKDVKEELQYYYELLSSMDQKQTMEEIDEELSEVEGIDQGGVAYVIHLDHIVLKFNYMDSEGMGYFEDEFMKGYLEIQDDGTIIQKLVDLSCLPIVYGFMKTRIFVVSILEKIEGTKLVEAYPEKIPTAVQERIQQYFEEIYEKGYFPYDTRVDDVLITEDGKIKLIDYNLYQRLDYIRGDLRLEVSKNWLHDLWEGIYSSYEYEKRLRRL